MIAGRTIDDDEPNTLAPDLLTVAEAAVVVRVGRSTACELVRRDRSCHTTGDCSG